MSQQRDYESELFKNQIGHSIGHSKPSSVQIHENGEQSRPLAELRAENKKLKAEIARMTERYKKQDAEIEELRAFLDRGE